MWIIEEDCPYFDRPKMCLCIGPENCMDTSCRLVRDYLRGQKCLKRRIDEMIKRCNDEKSTTKG